MRNRLNAPISTLVGNAVTLLILRSKFYGVREETGSFYGRNALVFVTVQLNTSAAAFNKGIMVGCGAGSTWREEANMVSVRWIAEGRSVRKRTTLMDSTTIPQSPFRDAASRATARLSSPSSRSHCPRSSSPAQVSATSRVMTWSRTTLRPSCLCLAYSVPAQTIPHLP